MSIKRIITKEQIKELKTVKAEKEYSANLKKLILDLENRVKNLEQKK